MVTATFDSSKQYLITLPKTSFTDFISDELLLNICSDSDNCTGGTGTAVFGGKYYSLIFTSENSINPSLNEFFIQDPETSYYLSVTGPVITGIASDNSTSLTGSTLGFTSKKNFFKISPTGSNYSIQDINNNQIVLLKGNDGKIYIVSASTSNNTNPIPVDTFSIVEKSVTSEAKYFTFLLLGIFFSIIAICMFIYGGIEIYKKNKGFGIVGLILGGVVLIMAIVLFLIYFNVIKF